MKDIVQDELAECETIIERGLETFVEVGTALLRVRDKTLYKPLHSTFESYCKKRWGISRIHAHRLIEASSVMNNLLPIGNRPETESQARPLAPLSPDNQQAAWKQAVETAPNGKPTAAHVKETIDQMFPRPRETTSERTERKMAELTTKAAQAPEPVGDSWEVVQGDCVGVLQDMESKSARLVFADPPYNIGIEYGEHYDDSRPFDEYEQWCREWMTGISRVLTWDGSFFLLSGLEWAPFLCNQAVDLGFHYRQWITWYETFGVNCSDKYNRCSRALIWFTKHRATFIWNPEAVNRPSDRQLKYNDARANPNGKNWDDVWGINPPIPRLTGTAAERLPGFPTQLPLSLLRPIIAAHSNRDDLVIDPFSGSGTTGKASIELGRRFIGIELSPEFAELSRLRLVGV